MIDGYVDALGFARMGVFLRNSLAYTVVALFVQLTINSFAAYSFARIPFKGRDPLFILFLATMMLPGSVTLIPNYVLVYSLGMADTFIGVVIPSFAGAFGVFLLRQFFLGIPSELRGCGPDRRRQPVQDLLADNRATCQAGHGHPGRVHSHRPMAIVHLASGRIE